MAKITAMFFSSRKRCICLREFLYILLFSIIKAEIIYLSVVAEIPWVIPILELLPLGKDQVEIHDVSYV